MSLIKIFARSKADTQSKKPSEIDCFELPQEFTDSHPRALHLDKAVLQLTSNMFPLFLWQYISESAANMDNTAPDYCAVSTIILVASVAGANVAIQPKKNCTRYLEKPIFWGAAVGEPSDKKSPSISSSLSIYSSIQSVLDKRYEAELKDYHDSGADGPPPGRKKLIVNDVTREALTDHLKHNTNGVLQIRDELTGWLSDLSQEKNATARSFYLTGFSAEDTPYFESRRTQGEIYLPRIVISVFGGIQPAMLSRFLQDRESGKLNDGMLERFQLMVYPKTQGEYTDYPANETARERMIEALECIYSFCEQNDEQVIFKFSKEAQSIYERACKLTYRHIEKAVEQQDTHLCSRLGKHNGLLAKLSLVLQLLIDVEALEVGVEAIHYAQKWMIYLESHQRKIYSLLDKQKKNEAAYLLEKLRLLPTSFTSSDFSTKGWKYLTTAVQRNNALNVLVDSGYLFPQYLKSGSKGGRPAIVYHKHPSLN